jgi:zinc/manganese transport system ATP-binding protein
MTDPVLVQRVTAYHGTTLAVDGIEAAFAPGTVTAVSGGNGSGKSTLLALVAGVHRAAAGRVVRPAGGVAFVRQSWSADRPLPLTVRSAVAMGRWRDRGPWARLRADDRALVSQAMSQLGLADLARRPLDALSGGQRQRALVAQALAQRAPVLLLDEPTAGVDDAARRWIEDAMAAEARRGVVVVHVTHDASSVERADRRLHLAAGRVVDPVGRTG